MSSHRNRLNSSDDLSFCSLGIRIDAWNGRNRYCNKVVKKLRRSRKAVRRRTRFRPMPKFNAWRTKNNSVRSWPHLPTHLTTTRILLNQCNTPTTMINWLILNNRSSLMHSCFLFCLQLEIHLNSLVLPVSVDQSIRFQRTSFFLISVETQFIWGHTSVLKHYPTKKHETIQQTWLDELYTKQTQRCLKINYLHLRQSWSSLTRLHWDTRERERQAILTNTRSSPDNCRIVLFDQCNRHGSRRHTFYRQSRVYIHMYICNSLLDYWSTRPKGSRTIVVSELDHCYWGMMSPTRVGLVEWVWYWRADAQPWKWLAVGSDCRSPLSVLRPSKDHAGWSVEERRVVAVSLSSLTRRSLEGVSPIETREYWQQRHSNVELSFAVDELMSTSNHDEPPAVSDVKEMD